VKYIKDGCAGVIFGSSWYDLPSASAQFRSMAGTRTYLTIEETSERIVCTDHRDGAVEFKMELAGVYCRFFVAGGSHDGKGLCTDKGRCLHVRNDYNDWLFRPSDGQFQAMQCHNIIGTSPCYHAHVNCDVGSEDKHVYCRDPYDGHTCAVKVHQCRDYRVILEIRRAPCFMFCTVGSRSDRTTDLFWCARDGI